MVWSSFPALDSLYWDTIRLCLQHGSCDLFCVDHFKAYTCLEVRSLYAALVPWGGLSDCLNEFVTSLSAHFLSAVHKQYQSVMATKSKTSFKRILLSGCMQCFVIRVLDVYKLFIPRRWVPFVNPPWELNQTLVWPSICGWKIVHCFSFVSKFSHNVVQNLPKNLESMYDTIEQGPKWIHTFEKNNFAVGLDSFLTRYRSHILLNLSTTTNKLIWPHFDIRNPPTKSMDILTHHSVKY